MRRITSVKLKTYSEKNSGNTGGPGLGVKGYSTNTPRLGSGRGLQNF